MVLTCLNYVQKSAIRRFFTGALIARFVAKQSCGYPLLCYQESETSKLCAKLLRNDNKAVFTRWIPCWCYATMHPRLYSKRAFNALLNIQFCLRKMLIINKESCAIASVARMRRDNERVFRQ